MYYYFFLSLLLLFFYSLIIYLSSFWARSRMYPVQSVIVGIGGGGDNSLFEVAIIYLSIFWTKIRFFLFFLIIAAITFYVIPQPIFSILILAITLSQFWNNKPLREVLLGESREAEKLDCANRIATQLLGEHLFSLQLYRDKGKLKCGVKKYRRTTISDVEIKQKVKSGLELSGISVDINDILVEPLNY